MDYAFQYVEENHGIDTEKDVPTLRQVVLPPMPKSTLLLSSFVDVDHNDEDVAAVAQQPVSVANLTPSHFQFSKGNI